MAQLQSGTRIYGTANVDTQLSVASGNVVSNSSGVYVNNFILASNSYITTANITYTGTRTLAANLIFTTGQLIANNANGASGQILYSNGTGIYWANASAGFTNGQSISVNTFQFAGQVIANGFIGSSGVYLAGNSTGGVFWSNNVLQANVVFGDVAPSNPYNGLLWFDSNNGLFSAYYSSSGAWVATNGGVIGPSGYSGSVGFSGSIGTTLPLNAQTNLYVIQGSDNGSLVTAFANVTVNTGIFSNGQNFTIYNNAGKAITIIANTGVTLLLAGTTTTGNRTMANNALATVICVAGNTGNTFVVAGQGTT